MRRNLAAALLTPQVSWCPPGRSSLAEDETTKKVPEHLVALAMALEDEGAADVHTARMARVVQAHESGIASARTSLPREVISPPPRRPFALTASSVAFEESLEAFLRSGPKLVRDGDDDSLHPMVSPTSRQRHASGRVHPAHSQSLIVRSAAAVLVAATALAMLFSIDSIDSASAGAPKVAREATTLHARASLDDPSGRARDPQVDAKPVAASKVVPRRTPAMRRSKARR